MRINFLQETFEVLKNNNKSSDDVLWVENEKEWCSWNSFVTISDFEYDDGFGISIYLKIVGKDWWLERHEYEGSEWWEFKSRPKQSIGLELYNPTKYFLLSKSYQEYLICDEKNI